MEVEKILTLQLTRSVSSLVRMVMYIFVFHILDKKISFYYD